MTKFVENSASYASLKEAVSAALDKRIDELFSSDEFIGEMYKKHPGRKDHEANLKHADDEEAAQKDTEDDDMENPSNETKGGPSGSASRKADD